MSEYSPQPSAAIFSWRSVVILTTATLSCLLPLAGKAFHIDDPVFIWIAQQIQSNPTDFFGFTINWTGHEIPMWKLASNPPINSYFIAFVAYFFGWSETALHLAFLIPAVAIVLGTWYLAQQLCSRPLLAALAALATPVFLVSATNVMSDTIMLSFWVWAVGLWVRGIAGGDHRFFLASTFLASLAVMTKFFAISLIPLLFVYSLAQKRELAKEQWWLLVPLFFLLGYEWITRLMYGTGMFSSALNYTDWLGIDLSKPFLLQGLIGLSFTGGCLATVIIFAPVMQTRKLLPGILLFIISLIILTPFLLHNKPSFKTINWPLVLQFVIFIAGGLGLLALAIADFWKHKDSGSILLLLWVFGTFIFATYINWTVNSRSIMPMIPAMGILLVRRIERHSNASSQGTFWKLGWPIIPAAMLTLMVAWADFKMANTIRDAAREFTRQYNSPWFGGHWGFQYYMQDGGAKPIEIKKTNLKTGDILIVPKNIDVSFHLSWGMRNTKLERTVERPAVSWLATMNTGVWAGFYSHSWGFMPFAFGKVPPEQFSVFRY